MAPVTPTPRKKKSRHKADANNNGDETNNSNDATKDDLGDDRDGRDGAHEVRRHPFIAPRPGKWRERYAPACVACEAARLPCRHHPEIPLKLLVVGHNPSHHSWGSGYSYSNPSNNFWKLLVKGGVIPQDWTVEDCARLPGELGIGFTDAGQGTFTRAKKSLCFQL